MKPLLYFKLSLISIMLPVLSNLAMGQKYPKLSDTLIEGKRMFGYKQNNHFVIPPQFRYAHAFSENMAVVKSENYYYFIDYKGNKAANRIFTNARPFAEGLAAAEFSEGWGFVNSGMKIQIAPKYKACMSFSENCAAVKDSKWFFINRKNSIVSSSYDTISEGFRNGLAIAGNKQEDWKFGVINKYGAWVIPCRYRAIRRNNKDLFIADSSQGYASVFDQTGKLINHHLENIRFLGDSLIMFEQNGKNNLLTSLAKVKAKNFKDLINNQPVYFNKWKLTDSAFSVLLKCEADSFITEGSHIIRCLNYKKQLIYPDSNGMFYEEIKALNDYFLKVKRNNSWGISDKKGNAIIPVQYDYVSYVHPYFLVQREGKVGLLDSAGKIVAPLMFDQLKIYHNPDKVCFQNGSGSGYFNIHDKTLKILPETDSVTPVNDSLLLCWKRNSCQMVNVDLEPVVEKVFKNASLVTDTSVVAYDTDSLYYYNLKSKTWSAKKERICYFLNDTLALIKLDTLLGVHHFQSDSIYIFEGDTAWRHPILTNRLLTRKGTYFGFAALEGRLLTNYNRCLSYIGLPVNGFMEVISRKKYGFIDTNGYLLIATQYDSVKKVINGHAAVKINGKWGYVNRKEAIVVQPNYTNATGFMGNTGPVWIGTLATLADDQGKELFKPRFNHIYPTKQGYWLSKRNNLFGFMNSDGRELYNPRFSFVEETYGGYFIVVQYERKGVLNKNLETVLPFENRNVKFINKSFLFYVEDTEGRQ